MKKLVPVFLIMLTSLLNAQIEHNLTQNAQLAAAWNPAFIPQSDFVTISLAYRKAWTGMSSAPQIYLLNAYAPLASNKSGAGLLAKSETFGNMKRISIMLDGAYAVHLINHRISFGLRLGVESVSSSLNTIDLINQDDKNFKNNFENIMLPNAGFGVAIANKKWGAGFSIPRLLQADVIQSATSVDINQKVVTSELHTCLYGFRKFQVKEKLEVQASLFGRTVGHRLPYSQVAVQCTYNKLLSVGGSYQYNQSASLLLMLHWKNYAVLGYSYDFPVNNHLRAIGASHELVVSGSLNRSEAKVSAALTE